MYLLNQNIANKIAAEQRMATEEMRNLFLAQESKAKVIESAMHTEILNETGDEQVASAIVAYLPILVENEAITKYIEFTGNYDLRVQTPEIITAKEAGLFAELEFSLNQEQTDKAIQIMNRKLALLSTVEN
jgi:hypothetical protein